MRAGLSGTPSIGGLTITTPSRFRGGVPRRRSAATVGSIMGALRLPAKTRLWAAIGLMFIVALFASAPASLAAPSGGHDHHVTAAGEFDHLADVDHEHIGASAIQSAPDAFGDALPPRMRVALLVLGLTFALGLLWRFSPRHTVLVGRDPPRAPDIVSLGRDVLTRLCISRR